MKNLTRRDFVKISATCSALVFLPDSVFGDVSFKRQGLVFSCEDWKSQWIWDQENKKNSWVCFRKNLNLNAIPNKAVAKIAVDSKYWLWINGQPCTAEVFGELVGTLDQYLVTAFVQQADYAARLYPGSPNTIRVITLWYHTGWQSF